MKSLSKVVQQHVRKPAFWIVLFFWIGQSAFFWWLFGSLWAGVALLAYALVAGVVSNRLYERRAGDKDLFSAFSEDPSSDPWRADEGSL